jgi:hypothetical protein
LRQEPLAALPLDDLGRGRTLNVDQSTIEQRQRKLSLDKSPMIWNRYLFGHGAGALAGDGGQWIQ